VKVIGAANVVSRNECDECSSSIRASGLDATQSIGEHGGIGPITIASRLNAGVHTLVLLIRTPSKIDMEILTVALVPHISTYASVTGLQVVVSTTLISKWTGGPFSVFKRFCRISSPVTPLLCQIQKSTTRTRFLTVWAFGCLRVKRTSRVDAVFLFNLANIATNNLMRLREASFNTKFVKTSLAPQMLILNPATLNQIPFARRNVSSFRVVEMSLSPQNLLVGVAAWVGNSPRGQKHNGECLSDLDHFDVRNKGSVDLEKRTAAPGRGLIMAYYTCPTLRTAL
jgi:hypothetical protein